MQTDQVLEELRFLHRDPIPARGVSSAGSHEEGLFHTGQSLSIGGDLQVHPYSDTLLPTRPHLLIVPLSGSSIHKPSQCMDMCVCMCMCMYVCMYVSWASWLSLGGFKFCKHFDISQIKITLVCVAGQVYLTCQSEASSSLGELYLGLHTLRSSVSVFRVLWPVAAHARQEVEKIYWADNSHLPISPPSSAAGRSVR